MTKGAKGRKPRIKRYSPRQTKLIQERLILFWSSTSGGWHGVAEAITFWSGIEEFFPGTLDRVEKRREDESVPDRDEVGWPIRSGSLQAWVSGEMRDGRKAERAPRAEKLAAIAGFLIAEDSAFKLALMEDDNGAGLALALTSHIDGGPSRADAAQWMGKFIMEHFEPGGLVRHQVEISRGLQDELRVSHQAEITIREPGETDHHIRVRRLKRPIAVPLLKQEGWAAFLGRADLLAVLTPLYPGKKTSNSLNITLADKGRGGLEITGPKAPLKASRLPVFEDFPSIKFENLQNISITNYNIGRRSGEDVSALLTSFLNAANKFNSEADKNPPAPNKMLIDALRYGDANRLAVALRTGADLNYVDPEFGDTAVLVASRHGHEGMLETLLVAGADINAVNSITGQTALHLAIPRGNPKTIEILLSNPRSLNVGVKDSLGYEPWNVAMEYKYMRLAMYLIKISKARTGERVRLNKFKFTDPNP